MANVKISDLRDALHKGTITPSGSRLSEPAFKRVMKNPKIKEKLGQKTYNANKIIRKITNNDDGEITSRQSEAVVEAAQEAMEEGVSLEGYGEISPSHELKVHPKVLVRGLVRKNVDGQEPKVDFEALRLARRRLGQQALRNVRQGVPINARLTEVQKIRTGQLRAEAQEKREGTFSEIKSDPGSVRLSERPLVQDTGRISGATASYLTGLGAEAPLKTADEPEKIVPIVTPNEADDQKGDIVELEID